VCVATDVSFGLSAAAFYEEGIQKLVPRYDKCLSNGGEYVKKRFEECRI